MLVEIQVRDVARDPTLHVSVEKPTASPSRLAKSVQPPSQRGEQVELVSIRRLLARNAREWSLPATMRTAATREGTFPAGALSTPLQFRSTARQPRSQSAAPASQVGLDGFGVMVTDNDPGPPDSVCLVLGRRAGLARHGRSQTSACRLLDRAPSRWHLARSGFPTIVEYERIPRGCLVWVGLNLLNVAKEPIQLSHRQ